MHQLYHWQNMEGQSTFWTGLRDGRVVFLWTPLVAWLLMRDSSYLSYKRKFTLPQMRRCLLQACWLKEIFVSGLNWKKWSPLGEPRCWTECLVWQRVHVWKTGGRTFVLSWTLSPVTACFYNLQGAYSNCLPSLSTCRWCWKKVSLSRCARMTWPRHFICLDTGVLAPVFGFQPSG